MKTDEEIKQFIDSQEVLTIRDVAKFIYPNSPVMWGQTGSRVKKFWQYVLETKNWGKLRKYREQKIARGNFKEHNYNKYKDIYLCDPRIRDNGLRISQKVLLNVHGLKLQRNVIQSYKKRLINELQQGSS